MADSAGADRDGGVIGHLGQALPENLMRDVSAGAEFERVVIPVDSAEIQAIGAVPIPRRRVESDAAHIEWVALLIDAWGVELDESCVCGNDEVHGGLPRTGELGGRRERGAGDGCRQAGSFSVRRVDADAVRVNMVRSPGGERRRAERRPGRRVGLTSCVPAWRPR
ncbi:hypothetical protein BGLA2_700067 [Burkholderia gladioli]|nr:hypothetical protein BGLA2_700067 [Burkholderia gladioli]